MNKVNIFCDEQLEIVQRSEDSFNTDLEAMKSAQLNVFKNELEEKKLEAKGLVDFSEKMSPTQEIPIEINVRGEIVQTTLQNLTKVPGSRLEQIFSGKIDHGRD